MIGAAQRPSGGLRDFYENPEVPLSSGPDRARRQARMLASILRDIPPPGCVVDVGCGDGEATRVALTASPGHRFIGIDWSADALRQARARGLTSLLQAGVDGVGLPLGTATADVVVMSELIEHLVDTDSALEEAWRVLKPGGWLVLSTPNLAAWYNRGLLALGVQPVFSEVSLRGVFGRPGTVVAGHLHMFTRRALTGLLEARGFGSIQLAGARYHDVPWPLRPVDWLFCLWPSAASIMLARARKAMTADGLTEEMASGQRASGRHRGNRFGGRWLSAHGLAAAAGLALGLLALGPGLTRGFLLSYDMVFAPDPPFSRALLGLSGGPPRAVPSDAVITAAAHVLPADVVQKLILLLFFVLACAGAAALLRDGWQRIGGKRAPVLACLAGGVYYAWNPYVAERLLIGQWALLLGYAGLPWVVRQLCNGPVRLRLPWLLLVMLPAAIGGFAALAVTGIAAIPAALARGTGRERVRRVGIALAALALLSLPWLIPSLLMPVHTDPVGADLFAARADTPFGRIGSLVMLSGIWNSQTVPRGYGGPGAVFWLLVAACSLAGYLLCVARSRLLPGLGTSGLISLGIAAIGITSPGRAMLHDLIAAWAAFGILRDGQQYVAPLALVEAMGIGAATAWLLDRFPAAQGDAPDCSGVGRHQGPAVVLAVFALVTPLLLVPGMAWGEFGRLRPVQYPADWLVARL